MTTTRRAPGIWVGQGLHFVSLGVLLVAVWGMWKYLKEPFPVMFWCAVALPILHQVYVWLTWRLALRSDETRTAIDFRGYMVVFFLLFAGRFVSLLALAWLDRGSLGLGIVPRVVLSTLLALPGLYAMYSVGRYFGMSRAAGADHFDPRYRTMPLATGGIFRFTNNGMYAYAFLLFWLIAVGFDSAAALAVAAFSHAYIWVHFHATEKPDMRYLHASADQATDG